MQSSRLLLLLLGSLLTLSVAIPGSQAQPAKPDFMITSTNVTMSNSAAGGSGTTTFTLTSLDGYTGTVQVICEPPSPPAGVKVPYCGGGPVSRAYTLTANEVVSGSLSFNNSAVPEAVGGLTPHDATMPPQGLVLAGLLLLGFGMRRRAARWLTVMLIAGGALAGLAGISACAGGNNSVVTPGTYAYTIKGMDTNTSLYATTSINVTVP
jgi:hypothetical protein